MPTFKEQILSTATATGLALSDPQAGLIARHLQMVAETNEVMNITSVPAGDFVSVHAMDSLSAARFLAEAPEGAFADLGSGGGFPGVPLAIMSGRPVVLVESVKKKAAFLEQVCRELGLEATVRAVRAEELALERGGAFAAVTARALSALPSLVELAAPLLAPGGRLVCLKGKADPEELQRGDRASARCGMHRVEVVGVEVPGLDAERSVVVYERTGKPTLKLPRRNGMAQRSPLA